MSPSMKPAIPTAVEGLSYSEAWCENCGERWKAGRQHDVTAAAEHHYRNCRHDGPSIIGETKVLWKVEAS